MRTREILIGAFEFVFLLVVMVVVAYSMAALSFAYQIKVAGL